MFFFLHTLLRVNFYKTVSKPGKTIHYLAKSLLFSIKILDN